MQESLQRVLAWAKANPVLAGAVVIGGGILVYFLIKGVGGTGEPTPLTTEDIGSGGGIGGDDVVPIAPIPDFLLPEPGYIGGDSWDTTPAGAVSFQGQSGSREAILRMEPAMKAAGFVPQEAVSTGQTRAMPNVESFRTFTGPPPGAQPTFQERRMPNVTSYRLPATGISSAPLSGQGFTTNRRGGSQE